MSNNQISNISNHENMNNIQDLNCNLNVNDLESINQIMSINHLGDVVEMVDYLKELFDDMVYFHQYNQYTPTWDKDDFFQDVMLKVMDEVHKYDPSRAGFPVWYSLIGKTIYFKHIGKDKKKPQVQSIHVESEDGDVLNLQDKLENAPSAEDDYMDMEIKKALHIEVSKLPDNYRKVIELTYFEGLNAEEIATKLGCSVDDVYRWRTRGLKKLSKILANEEIFESWFSRLAS